MSEGRPLILLMSEGAAASIITHGWPHSYVWSRMMEQARVGVRVRGSRVGVRVTVIAPRMRLRTNH